MREVLPFAQSFITFQTHNNRSTKPGTGFLGNKPLRSVLAFMREALVRGWGIAGFWPGQAPPERMKPAVPLSWWQARVASASASARMRKRK